MSERSVRKIVAPCVVEDLSAPAKLHVVSAPQRMGHSPEPACVAGKAHDPEDPLPSLGADLAIVKDKTRDRSNKLHCLVPPALSDPFISCRKKTDVFPARPSGVVPFFVGVSIESLMPERLWRVGALREGR